MVGLRRLPRRWQIVLDWLVTIVGAVAIVLALEHWVVKPYRVPSSSMEPTLNCARPGAGCEGSLNDRVLACRLCYELGSPKRGDIVVFDSPPLAETRCGAGGTYVKRLIGLPGDTVREDKRGFIWVDGRRLSEPYVQPSRRRQDVERNPQNLGKTWHVAAGRYFFLGDNRGDSCDSRVWGSVPRKGLVGKVVATYWPPTRISFR